MKRRGSITRSVVQVQAHLLPALAAALALLAVAAVPLPPAEALAPPIIGTPIVQGGSAPGPIAAFYPRSDGPSDQPPPDSLRGPSHVAYSPDGFALAVGTPVGIGVYSVADPTAVRSLRFIDTGAPVISLAFSPDGDLLASGSFTDTVQLWSAQTGALVRSLTAPQGAVNALAFGPGGSTLASASADGAVRLWRVGDGQLLWAAKGHLGAALAVAYLLDGSLLASGGVDGKLRIWQAGNGTALSELVGNLGGVPALALAPDGSAVALGAGDGAVRLWDIRANLPPQNLGGHRAGVTALDFAPDGMAFATGSYDGNVQIWQVPTGALLNTLPGPTGAVSSLAFAPSGASLALGAVDGAVQVLPLSAESPIRIVVVDATLAAPAPTPTPPAPAPTPLPTCADAAAFVADVTVPDNTVVAPGSLLNKTWRLRNSGTCPWGPGYQLQFLSGDRLGAASPQAVGATPPGGLADITVPMFAPNNPGIYGGVWQLAGPAGAPFGPRVTITVVVLPPAMPTVQPLPLPTADLGPPPPVPQSPAPSEPMVDISASAAEIDAGSRVTVRVSVANVQAAWLDGEAVVNNYGEKTVELCDDRTFTAEALLGDGQRLTRSVTVRVRGQCEEPPITFTEPDLVVTAATASPSTVKVGRSVKFSATITNHGDAGARGFQVALMLGELRVATLAEGLNLPAGDEKTIEKSVALPVILGPGSHKLTVWVDSTNTEGERREDNNKRTVTVKVVLL